MSIKFDISLTLEDNQKQLSPPCVDVWLRNPAQFVLAFTGWWSVMTKLADNEHHGGNVSIVEDVHLLAARALAALVEARTPQPQRLVERIQWLSDQFLGISAEEGRQAIDQILGDGVSANDVIDHVLPAIACRLGERWFEDDISFVDVTIGTARLQETVRQLRARERGTQHAAGRDARVLLIIPGPEEHTLGVVIAADQLRRRGIMVELSVAEKRNDLLNRLRTKRYGMIGITASGVRTLASVKELVDAIKRHTQQFVPVVLGGPLAESDAQLLDRIAIDIISTDICAAARQCGLLPAGRDVNERLGQ